MLLTELENNRGNVLVIMAGYAHKMEDLMNSDPGMPRRFAKTIDLPDYSPENLSEIAVRYADKIELQFEKELQKISTLKTPNKVLGLFKIPEKKPLPGIPNTFIPPFLLLAEVFSAFS